MPITPHKRRTFPSNNRKGKIGMSTTKQTQERTTLPKDGMSRFKQFQTFLPISRETWRQLVAQGKAPKPVRMGVRCTLWKNSELHEFLNDPLNYRAEG